MSDFLGYARVSTTDQNPELQQDALNAAGCFRIWTDKASGAKTDRPELAAVMDALRPGDTLVVWRLARLGRSLPHLIETVTQLEARGVAFKSLTEEINTTTPGGKLIFHIFGALAEFERNLIRERTMAGLSAARDRGRAREALRVATNTAADLHAIRGVLVRLEVPVGSDSSISVSDSAAQSRKGTQYGDDA